MDSKTVTEKSVRENSTSLILVVDDDEDNRVLLEHAVSIFGWRAIAAINGAEAIAKAKEIGLILFF